jgi:membrane associated rhomboid family serine protease
VGIYDRDYYRQERPGSRWTAPRSAVVVLICINAAVYVAEVLFRDAHLADWLSVHVNAIADPGYPNTLTHPLDWWQFLTCGFVHDPNDFTHILFNMLALWFLGRDVEALYGAREFTRIYLVLLVFGSVVWAVVNQLHGLDQRTDFILLGASGAVTGVVILYALCFPRRMLLFMFVLPMPAWVLGIIVVGYDILGQMGWLSERGLDHNAGIAYAVHLAGAALAFVYYQQRWNFGRLVEGPTRWLRRGTLWAHRPRLRVHAPDDPQTVPEEEVDRILEKIHREGEGGLTRKERRILEDASRQYQRRRRGE